MRWELRARAAEQGMTTSAQVRRRLAAAGLTVSAGKMSSLWSKTPLTVRLDDLDVLCAVLSCGPSALLVPEPPPAPPAPPPGLTPAARTADTAAGVPLHRRMPPL
ncbi:helix-turn-helix domain-containing protein [Streptomyces sp. NPDC060011]|uniref:helix-turn-helix domain-containing protein n=1 Tax=Streptomyces sp. NPDC060011 TaxID=3347037 RepID=UPI00368FF494